VVQLALQAGYLRMSTCRLLNGGVKLLLSCRCTLGGRLHSLLLRAALQLGFKARHLHTLQARTRFAAAAMFAGSGTTLCSALIRLQDLPLPG
jgi:hypothetical protein